jgi:NADH-quinone oxidoreductase subunit H
MLAATILKTLFILLVVVAGLAPLLTWVERKQSTVTRDRLATLRVDVGALKWLGLFQPLADALKLLPRADFLPAGANRALHLLAPLLALLPAMTAFAVIPFGGVYRMGDVTLSLVVSNADWGMLYVFAIGALATTGSMIAAWSSARGGPLLGNLRSAAQMFSCQLTLGLSLVGVFMVFESLKLQDISQAQDTTLRAFGFLGVLFGASHSTLDWLRLPAWGVVYQPLAFVLFLTSSLAASKRPPFQPSGAAAAPNAAEATEHSSLRCGLMELSQLIQVVVIAALVTVLFLGGWTIPYLSTELIVGGMSALLGSDFANFFCLGLHFASFMLKVCAMIWLQLALGWMLPRYRTAQVMRLCWRLMLPLALANILITGCALLFVGEAA